MGRITETHICCSYCYYGNNECWQRNKYTNDFDAWMQESEVNLTLVGVRLLLTANGDCTLQVKSDIYDCFVLCCIMISVGF